MTFMVLFKQQKLPEKSWQFLLVVKEGKMKRVESSGDPAIKAWSC